MVEEEYLQSKRDITVAVGDMDFNNRIKPCAIMEYFQDIATEHAEILGVGYADMLAKNLVWVMSRVSMKILKSPLAGEILTVKTFPEKPKAAEVNRGYYLYNKAGDLVISGSSKWCVLTADTHAIRRCAPHFEFDDSLYVPYEPFQDANPKVAALKDLENTVTEGPFPYRVEVSDLDRNFHMNNACYGDVVLNVCGVEKLKTHMLARLDVNFISELFIGDRYEVYKAHRDSATYFEAKKSGSDAVIFRARAEWRPDCRE